LLLATAVALMLVLLEMIPRSSQGVHQHYQFFRHILQLSKSLKPGGKKEHLREQNMQEITEKDLREQNMHEITKVVHRLIP
jgi:Spy/CpxP family protein refolding chaperone